LNIKANPLRFWKIETIEMAVTKKTPVRFCFQKATPLRDRQRLKLFIKKMVGKEGYLIKDIQVVFCDDNYLLNINKLYLKHNYLTDIITFDYSEKSELTAELYISCDRVKENASGFAVSFRSELHRVIFHGILHLIGYKDKKPVDQSRMRSMEDKWLTSYGIS
jgi:rRNA maturation RNase YbeY